MTKRVLFLTVAGAALLGCGANGAAPTLDPSFGLVADAGSEDAINASGEDAAVVDDGTASDGSPDGERGACPIRQTAATSAGAARSAGFTGSDQAYYSLYDVACQSTDDCSASCLTAGGSASSCGGASECPDALAGDQRTCLPPTYWLNAKGALSQSGSTMNAAMLILVDLDYHDALVVSDFKLDLPNDAVITGIQFKVRRSADTGAAADDAVRILKNGIPVGADRGQPGSWPMTLTWATFGDAYDTWGESWTPADVRASGFGLSIAPRYDATAGNDRAHIDSIRATVFYAAPCK